MMNFLAPLSKIAFFDDKLLIDKRLGNFENFPNVFFKRRIFSPLSKIRLLMINYWLTNV